MLNASNTNNKALELTTRQMTDFSLQNTLKIKCFDYFTEYTFLVEGLKSLSNNDFTDLRVLRDRVDVLNLD
jgi:hypothetical protein